MSIIEKIRAEVERRKKEIHATVFNDEYDSLLSFLSDLEKEEKPIEGLEEEIYRWWGEEYIKNSEGLPILPIVQGIARHFAQWQKERDEKDLSEKIASAYQLGLSDKEKQMISALKNDGDLPTEFIDKFHEIDRTAFQNGQENMKEQMMDEWLKDRDGCFWDGVNEGKKAMKEQMLKEAVEVEVTETCGISSVWIKTKQFKPGQKVKLIIVKEDKK